MRITSNILGDIGRAMRLAAPSPQEPNINIPAAVAMTMEPRACLDTGFGASPGSSTAVMNSSWSGGTLGQTNNNGPLGFFGSFCNSGLWRIDWQVQYFCNFVSTAGVSNFQLINAAQTKQINLASFYSAIANTSLTVSGSCLVNLSEPFQPECLVAPSGVGQTTFLSAAWVCNKVIL